MASSRRSGDVARSGGLVDEGAVPVHHGEVGLEVGEAVLEDVCPLAGGERLRVGLAQQEPGQRRLVHELGSGDPPIEGPDEEDRVGLDPFPHVRPEERRSERAGQVGRHRARRLVDLGGGALDQRLGEWHEVVETRAGIDRQLEEHARHAVIEEARLNLDAAEGAGDLDIASAQAEPERRMGDLDGRSGVGELEAGLGGHGQRLGAHQVDTVGDVEDPVDANRSVLHAERRGPHGRSVARIGPAGSTSAGPRSPFPARG